jgi:arsenate reductase
VEPLSEDEIRTLVRKTGEPPAALLRRKEPVFRELGLADGNRSDDELIALMAEHPALLQRPIVEVGDRAVLARPPERVLDLL